MSTVMGTEAATTAARRPFQPDDAFRFAYVQDADLSPDGRLVAYTAVRTEGDRDVTAMRLLDIDSGTERTLGESGPMEMHPRFSPDGAEIAFVSTRAGAPQLFVVPVDRHVDGDEARQLTDLPLGVAGAPLWSPDGARVAFLAGPQQPRDPGAPYRVTRPIYRVEGLGRVENLLELYVVDVDATSVIRLTDDPWMVTKPVWLPDGSALAYVSALEPDSTSPVGTTRVVGVDGTQREFLSTTEGPRGLVTVAFAPDGRAVFVEKVPKGSNYAAPGTVWVVDGDGRNPIHRTPSLEDGHILGDVQGDVPVGGWASNSPVLVADNSSAAYAPIQRGGEVHIHRIALDGAEDLAPVTSGPRCCIPLARRGERLLFLSGTMDRPADLHLLDGATERRLTDLNATIRTEIAWPHVEHLELPGSDANPIEGWLLTPASGVAPHPTVLYVHGGPNIAWGQAFSIDAQLLAGADYAVLLVNYRGSTGYGREFATSLMGAGAWGSADYEDLMSAVDHTVAAGTVDPDRLGVCGLSNGGTMTCWIVGHTDRFKAAVAENSITDFASLYGVIDLGVQAVVEIMGGHLHEIPEVYRNASPLTYAHNCTTPTLLVQGETDLRCPAGQSEQFYTALTVAGCPTEMLRLPGVGHLGAVAGPVPIRRAQNDALLDWMDRYVRDARRS